MDVQQVAALKQRLVDQSEQTRFWPLVRLGDYCAVQNGFPFKSDYFSEESGVPLIRVRSLKTQSCDIRYSSSYDPAYLVYDGNVLIGMDGDFQPCLWSGGEALLNQRVCRLVEFSPELDPYYAYQALKGPLDQLEQTTHFTTVKHLSAFTIQDIRIPLPPLSEQRAIACALRAVHEAIQARRHEVELERERKAALMQQLFTHGTRGEPTKQTEIGEMPESWRVARFSDVVDIVQGQVDPKVEPYSSMLHVGPDSIEEGSGKLLSLKSAQDLNLISGKYLFSPEHVLYSKIRPYLRKAALPTFTGICSADMYPLRPHSGVLLREFLLYMLLSEQFTAQVTAAQDRTGIPKVNRNQLGAVALPAPTPEEQREVANILCALDARTTAVEHEAGLLEELFRALLEELMTGRLSALPLIETAAAEVRA